MFYFLLCTKGGLLIDTGFLTLKPKDYERGIKNYHENSLLPNQSKIEVAPMFELSDPVITEWRALTVAYLDLVAEKVRQTFRLSKKALSLSQLIQGGTSSVSNTFLFLSSLCSNFISRLVENWQKFQDQIRMSLLL